MNYCAVMATPTAPPGNVRRKPQERFQIEQFQRGQPGREELEAFIATSFRKNYGADVRHFCDVLLSCRDAHGQLIAVLGYTLASANATFLEHYLDEPVERALAAKLDCKVDRREIVEVGNLASTHAGAARVLIVSTTRLLHDLGLRWVAFTATSSLLNSFARLRLQPQVLTNADPMRLPDRGSNWGSYYGTQPKVMFGDIRYGYAHLS